MPDHLPTELLCMIGLKLDSTGDRIRFRAVSKSWMSSLPFRQPPWLMLSQSKQEEYEEQATQPRGFVSIGDQTISRVDFPEIHRARVAGSTGTWLITTHLDKTIRVSNPFSRLQFHLPSRFGVECFPPYTAIDRLTGFVEFHPKMYRNNLLFKVVQSSDHPDRSDTYWVAILNRYQRMLLIGRPGDASWTPARSVDCPADMDYWVMDVVIYKQKVYAVNFEGRVLLCDVGDQGVRSPQVWFLTDEFSCNFSETFDESRYYLVEWLGELLFVVRCIEYNDDQSCITIAFKVFKFDLVNKKFDELKNLGDHSLFLGSNTSVSLQASDYFGLVRSNCIYFTDDNDNAPYLEEFGHDMGVFDLEDNSITPHYKGLSISRYSPPVWIISA